MLSPSVTDREKEKFEEVSNNPVVRIKEIEVEPTATGKTNPSLTLTNADEVVDSTKTLTMTIGATSYESTLSYNAGGDFLSMSAWSEV